MQLGTEICKMTRKLFTGFSKSRPWMLNTADRMAVNRNSDRRRDDLCGVGLRKRASAASHGWASCVLHSVSSIEIDRDKRSNKEDCSDPPNSFDRGSSR